MPSKMAGRDYNKLFPGFVMSQTQIKPRPREHAAKGARPCCAALEKRKRKLEVHVKIYSYIAILSSDDSNGFTSFKINVLKQRFLILLLAASCSAHALLCISLSLSFRSSAQRIHIFYISVHLRHCYACVLLDWLIFQSVWKPRLSNMVLWVSGSRKEKKSTKQYLKKKHINNQSWCADLITNPYIIYFWILHNSSMPVCHV